jgi:hypothetical protein
MYAFIGYNKSTQNKIIIVISRTYTISVDIFVCKDIFLMNI